MIWLRKGGSRLFRGQRGISLLEILVAVALVAVVAIAFLQALRSTSTSRSRYEGRVTASNLAQSQLEILKAAPYDSIAPYYDNVSAPAGVSSGYSISISTVATGNTSQNITVTVNRGGSSLLKLSTIKVNR